mmetsp:Transcript_11015/g.29967  ORF Transcript_11015/g.29967 Transcript_11015/m.29967 type:complete len:88 (+) Transcript_11015:241-504(+)
MRRSTASCTSCSVCESRALVASSSNNNTGLTSSARAMATRCFWPPERFWPSRPTLVSKAPGSAVAKEWTFAAMAAPRISSLLASSLP